MSAPQIIIDGRDRGDMVTTGQITLNHKRYDFWVNSARYVQLRIEMRPYMWRKIPSGQRKDIVKLVLAEIDRLEALEGAS